jgi:transcriptional regulator with XRE-family HTH domain
LDSFTPDIDLLRMKKGLPQRLAEARKNKGLSQQELATAAAVHYTNIGRYERGEANPSTDILNRIAKALEASPDFLMNGTLQDKSADAIEDEELLLQFRKIEKLPSDKKKIVKELIDAFIFKADLQKQLQQG